MGNCSNRRRTARCSTSVSCVSADPTGAQAATLAPELSARLIERARALLDQQALDAAQAHLAAARQLDLNLTEVGELESRLATARRPGAAEPQAVRTAELKRTRFVPPVYPRQALEDDVEGTVHVRITVDTDGTRQGAPRSCESTPAGVFDAATLAAVKPLALQAGRGERSRRRGQHRCSRWCSGPTTGRSADADRNPRTHESAPPCVTCPHGSRIRPRRRIPRDCWWPSSPRCCCRATGWRTSCRPTPPRSSS